MNNPTIALTGTCFLKSCGTTIFTIIIALILMNGCTQHVQQSAKKQPVLKEVSEVESHGSNIKKDEKQDVNAKRMGTVSDGNKKTPDVIHEKPSVSVKGTNIKALVNGYPITSYDIRQRAAFLKLRKIGGNRTKKAREELIEEQLKIQEAEKLGFLASDDAVNRALTESSRGNQLTVSEMRQVFNQAGISINHFREFLRGQISWQHAIGLRFQSNTRNLSQSDVLFNIRKSGEKKPQTQEYKLQQIIFVVPRKKRQSLLHLRLAEANSFFQRFANCDNTISQAKKLRDVSVKELGRILEPELPPLWKEDIVKTEAGKTTRPKKTEKGIEIIAVCSVRSISDDRTAQIVTQSKEFDSFNEKGDRFAREYLQELRSKSTIIYR